MLSYTSLKLKYYSFKDLLNMLPQPSGLAWNAQWSHSISLSQMNSHFFLSAKLVHIKVQNFISVQSSVYSRTAEQF